MSLPISYVLPLRSKVPAPEELRTYLGQLTEWLDDVIVADGSEPAIRAHHQRVWPAAVSVLQPTLPTLNGKVGGVITGVTAARHDKVVIADDDVRYDLAELAQLTELLDHADVVRPQNYFAPRPWHAVLDTARSSIGRVTGGDWPGTLGFRRGCFLRAGGYAGDVLFENLELVRTIQAVGRREIVALDLYVRRIPPDTNHFVRQQVRQAYDELARPARLLLSLAVLPATAIALRRGSWMTLSLSAITVATAAELGRRRAGGRRYFSAWSSLVAPAWLLGRSASSWIALGARARGGARYRGTRIRRAAHTSRALQRQFRHAPASAARTGITVNSLP